MAGKMEQKDIWMLERVNGKLIIAPKIDKVICSMGLNYQVLTDEDGYNAKLICALRNTACDINPSNPMAVAEGMKDVVEALKRAREDINWMLNNQQFLNPNTFDYIDSSLAKVEEGNEKEH